MKGIAMSELKPVSSHRGIYWAGGLIVFGCLALAAWFALAICRMELVPLMACVDDSSNPKAQWVCKKGVYSLRLWSGEVKELSRTAGASLAAQLADKDEAERMLKFFLSRGVDINSKDTKTTNAGLTALHNAVFSNRPKAVKLLLAHGAKADVRSNLYQTPFELAKELQQRYPSEDRSQVIKLLANAERPKYSGFVRYGD
jgi:hypothetical protein